MQGPLLGWLNDKFGPRPIMVLGTTTSGLGFILLSLTDNYIFFMLVFVGADVSGFRAGYNNALMPAINQWFRRRRALAMAVAGMGSPVGGLFIAPAVGLLVGGDRVAAHSLRLRRGDPGLGAASDAFRSSFS